MTLARDDAERAGRRRSLARTKWVMLGLVFVLILMSIGMLVGVPTDATPEVRANYALTAMVGIVGSFILTVFWVLLAIVYAVLYGDDPKPTRRTSPRS